MANMLRGLAVTILFFAGALAITLVCAATLFGVPAPDLPAVGILLLGVGGGGGLLALFLLLQRYFIAGISMGGVKR